MDELIRTAVVGLDQAGGKLPDGDPAIAALVDRLELPGRERALLLRAGCAAVYRRAGQLAQPAPQLPAPAPVNSRPACGPALGALVSSLFADRSPVLPEALELLAAAGRRLPPELLPTALDTTAPPLQARLRAVLGERGRWLAAIEGCAWVSAAVGDELPADADDRWQDAPHAHRLALLVLARRVDPARARRWIESTWSQEKADKRVELLAAVETGLDAADEPFLTRCLDDRSAGVRVAAAQLLWRLPGCELARQILARAGELVVWHAAKPSVLGRLRAAMGGTAAQGTLELRLPPEKFDAAWTRQGIVESAPPGLGRRQWWLAQMISAVPPGHWQASFAIPPAALIGAAAGHELGDAFLDGLTAAALRHDAKEWFDPLFQAWLIGERSHQLVDKPLHSLIERMPAAQAASRAIELLTARVEDPSPILVLPRPWPAAVADAFLAAVPRLDKGGRPHGWLTLLAEGALALPAGHLGREIPVRDPEQTDWFGRELNRNIDLFHAVLHVRRRLHEEIRREQHRPD